MPKLEKAAKKFISKENLSTEAAESTETENLSKEEAESTVKENLLKEAAEATVTETTEEEGKNKCQICGLSFKRIWNLERHDITVHQKISAFQCHLCPKEYTTKFYLNKHLKKEHNTKK